MSSEASDVVLVVALDATGVSGRLRRRQPEGFGSAEGIIRGARGCGYHVPKMYSMYSHSRQTVSKYTSICVQIFAHFRSPVRVDSCQ